MKILALFIDGLGGQFLNIQNKNWPQTPIDDFLNQIGGTLYNYCYSPAPDTPRCSACMWTGVYPKRNYCNSRVKWPNAFINRKIDNIWSILNKKEYKINIYMNSSTKKLGLVPTGYGECIYGDTIYDFFEKAEIVENSFNFFYLPDIHYVMDTIGFQEQSYLDGIILQQKIVKEIWEFYHACEKFDYVLMFSDHGFQMKDRRYKHLLCEDRIRTFMFVRRKGDKKLIVDKKLRSNLDIMPTICELLNYKVKNQLDGRSLFDPNGHRYILSEDMKDFSTEISQSAEHWCVITNDMKKHWLDCSGTWEHETMLGEFNEEKFEKIVKRKMSDYKKNRAVYDCSEKYRDYAKYYRIKNRFSNGQMLYKNIFYFKDIQIIKGKRVILYGAGTVGQDYYKQIKQIKEVDVVGWIDLNYKRINSLYKVQGLEILQNVLYDAILICMQNEMNVMLVKEMLTQLGVSEEKIVWEQPSICRNEDL